MKVSLLKEVESVVADEEEVSLDSTEHPAPSTEREDGHS